jgi:hypothetical protein
MESKEMTIHAQKTLNTEPVFLRLNKNVEDSSSNIDTDFNFDLARMKKAVNSKSCEVPKTNSFEEFDAWMNQI